ncbi:MAG: hypothetical protein IT426_21595 [Pirellulales bacterium]|nr:hypothetical protein [Pirellulales bacterium]
MVQFLGSIININELREHIICHLTSIVGRLPAPDVAIGAITKTDHPEFDNMQVIVGNQLLEQEDRSRRVDEKVAEVLDETYRRLFRVYESVSSYVKVLEWSHELPKEEKLTLASNANHEFWDYFLLNRIYIPPRLYEQIRTMAGKLTDIANGFTSVRRREERGLVDGVENGWTTAFKAMENEAGPLFKSLVRQIQERLGIQDTEETDTTKQSGGDTIG